MDYYIGMEITTGTEADAAVAAAGDIRTITAWPGVDLAEYEIVKVDEDRGLIHGVIISVAEEAIYSGLVSAIT